MAKQGPSLFASGQVGGLIAKDGRMAAMGFEGTRGPNGIGPYRHPLGKTGGNVTNTIRGSLSQKKMDCSILEQGLRLAED